MESDLINQFNEDHGRTMEMLSRNTKAPEGINAPENQELGEKLKEYRENIENLTYTKESRGEGRLNDQ